MRVGIAAAKSIAHLLDVPTIGVCSLDALAADATESTGEGDAADPTSVVVATLDARRREVYWATYRTAADGGEGRQRVLAPQVGSREDLLASVRERGQNVTFVGNWARDRADDLVSELAVVPLRATVVREHAGVPRVTVVARLAAAMAVREQWSEPAQLQAMYLRSPDVQISWETRPT